VPDLQDLEAEQPPLPHGPLLELAPNFRAPQIAGRGGRPEQLLQVLQPVQEGVVELRVPQVVEGDPESRREAEEDEIAITVVTRIEMPRDGSIFC
jgi:hypothetical protein